MFHYTLPAACPHWTVSLSSLPQVTAPDQRFRSASPLYLAVERRERERDYHSPSIQLLCSMDRVLLDYHIIHHSVSLLAALLTFYLFLLISE